MTTYTLSSMFEGVKCFRKEREELGGQHWGGEGPILLNWGFTKMEKFEQRLEGGEQPT